MRNGQHWPISGGKRDLREVGRERLRQVDDADALAGRAAASWPRSDGDAAAALFGFLA